MTHTPTIFTVTQLNQILQSAVEAVPALQNICIRGEISNYKLYPSGHHYFTLKDTSSSLRCVMFRGSAAFLRFRPENGMAVLAVGKISIYPRDGIYQLYCSRILPDGAGELNLAFEQLKRRLEAEGLFDEDVKKPLPAFPHTIGLVTSPSGAAVHDMLRILGKRYPLSKVVILPVRVQGDQAAGEIAGAIEEANRRGLADLLIVGRGGGSLEDLWAFNEEPVARAIYASEIPIISAVGHEPDVTISDYTADQRAATPSNAAELAVPDQQELKNRLQGLQKALASALTVYARRSRSRLDALSASPMLRDPMNLLRGRRQSLDMTAERLRSAEAACVSFRRQRLTGLAASLDAMSPLKVLTRGYAAVSDANGKLVTSAAQTKVDEILAVTFQDGAVVARVIGQK